MENDQLGQLPVELVERIRKEAAENDEIYRRRSPDNLDLSRIHYFHEEMLDWAIRQFGDLQGSQGNTPEPQSSGGVSLDRSGKLGRHVPQVSIEMIDPVDPGFK